MAQKITLNEVYKAVQALTEKIGTLDTRVLALEKASMKASKPAPASKGTHKKTSTKSNKAPKGKGNNTSSTKKGKGNNKAFDFSKIKGKTNQGYIL